MRSPTSAPASTSESQWSPSTTRDAATLAARARTGTATSGKARAITLPMANALRAWPEGKEKRSDGNQASGSTSKWRGFARSQGRGAADPALDADEQGVGDARGHRAGGEDLEAPVAAGREESGGQRATASRRRGGWR